MGRQLFTIGVYGTTEATFFGALREHGVTHFVDVRRRRGLRGPEYAYANAGVLQARLGELGIAYAHQLELAPSLETRQTQKAVDAAVGTRGERIELGPEFVRRYQAECLDGFDAVAFLEAFPADVRVVLFCVEKEPGACHRSLLAEWIGTAAGLEWRDITPARAAADRCGP